VILNVPVLCVLNPTGQIILFNHLHVQDKYVWKD